METAVSLRDGLGYLELSRQSKAWMMHHTVNFTPAYTGIYPDINNLPFKEDYEKYFGFFFYSDGCGNSACELLVCC